MVFSKHEMIADMKRSIGRWEADLKTAQQEGYDKLDEQVREISKWIDELKQLLADLGT